jgi:anti-sigma B factor antagonist
VNDEFRIEERAGEPPIVAVFGELDLATAPDLRDCLRAVVAGGQSTIVVDLLGVTFVDSTALGIMVSALKRCRELGGSLHVVIADPRILKVFEITGLTQVFTITDAPPVQNPPAGS